MSKFFQRDASRFVREHRERLKLSVEQLADMAEVASSFIRDVESGKVLPFANSSELVKIYDKLSQVNAKRVPAMPFTVLKPTAQAIHIASSEAGLLLLKAFVKIEDREKSRQVLEFVELVSTCGELTLMEALDVVETPRVSFET